MSILTQIRDCLEGDGTDVYFPSQHKGNCIKEYVVVKEDGATTVYGVSSERPIYTIMCYVPENNYSRLESFVIETKKKMKQIFPLVMYLGNETSSFYDEEIRGHMISFQYQGCRKIEYW